VDFIVIIRHGLLTVHFVVYFEVFLSDVITVGVMMRETWRSIGIFWKDSVVACLRQYCGMCPEGLITTRKKLQGE